MLQCIVTNLPKYPNQAKGHLLKLNKNNLVNTLHNNKQDLETKFGGNRACLVCIVVQLVHSILYGTRKTRADILEAVNKVFVKPKIPNRVGSRSNQTDLRVILNRRPTPCYTNSLEIELGYFLATSFPCYVSTYSHIMYNNLYHRCYHDLCMYL